ncbi:hypothetical protein C6496_21995 [Candidatus Poribacteria bacterium]|nr:MAG: hypothetical protein C6496_21995 [Candidatus Poribacteria bacterium]
MKLPFVFALLLLGAVIGLTGCYTQLGYYASADFDRRYHKVLEEEKMEHDSKTESEASELEKQDDEDSEGYYGKRKRSYRRTYSHPSRYDTYWSPYAPYPYYAYSPVWYPFHPWFSGYYRPYYRYYRSYYPYYGYYPYTNVYRRYYGGSRYVPLSRRTSPNRSNWRSESRRSRNLRSVTSPRTRSERPQRRIRNRNEN